MPQRSRSATDKRKVVAGPADGFGLCSSSSHIPLTSAYAVRGGVLGRRRPLASVVLGFGPTLPTDSVGGNGMPAALPAFVWATGPRHWLPPPGQPVLVACLGAGREDDQQAGVSPDGAGVGVDPVVGDTVLDVATTAN
jgi:hypothetical protein